MRILFFYPRTTLVGVTISLFSSIIAQATLPFINPDDSLYKSLIVISTILGSLGGVITALGGVVVALMKIKVENQKLSFEHDERILTLERSLEKFSSMTLRNEGDVNQLKEDSLKTRDGQGEREITPGVTDLDPVV